MKNLIRKYLEKRYDKLQMRLQLAYVEMVDALENVGIDAFIHDVDIVHGEPPLQHTHTTRYVMVFLQEPRVLNTYIRIDIDNRGRQFRIINRTGRTPEDLDPIGVFYTVSAKKYQEYLNEWARTAALAVLDARTWAD